MKQFLICLVFFTLPFSCTALNKLGIFGGVNFSQAMPGSELSFFSKRKEQLPTYQDSAGNGILHTAILYKRRDVYDYLLENKIGLNHQNNKGESVLVFAFRLDAKWFVTDLIQRKIAITQADKDGWAPIHYASSRSDLTAAQALIAGGASLSVSTFRGSTPLILAVRKQNKKMVRWMIKQPCLIDNKTNNGASALHYATENGSDEIVELLVGAGAKLNPIDIAGATPLLWSLWEERFSTAAVLLRLGANVNKADNTGTTPLMVAAFLGNLEITKLLVRYGALVGKRNQDTLRAEDIAKKRNHGPVYEYLMELKNR